MSDLLPESRMQNPTGVIRIEFGPWGRINMQPIFCANCGTLGAYVPAENMTFACWLCPGTCSEQWSPLPGTYTTPDEVFWEQAKAEMLAKYGHFLTEEGVRQAEADKTGALSTLLKESPIHRR
jgi:hypothetical protein